MIDNMNRAKTRYVLSHPWEPGATRQVTGSGPCRRHPYASQLLAWFVAAPPGERLDCVLNLEFGRHSLDIIVLLD
jgi:hypothetical protein